MTESAHYIVTVINTKTQKSMGVDFCNDLNDLTFKARMFAEDFGPDCVVLTHPSLDRIVLDAAMELARIDHESRVESLVQDAGSR